METSEKGYCVHKDYGVVSFVSLGRAMKVLSDGRIVIFNICDKMKLRPLASPREVEDGVKNMRSGLKGRVKGGWETVSVGSEFPLMCSVVGEMIRVKLSLSQENQELLKKLKKHIDLELSVVYDKRK
jgi:hypothetical protein